MLKKTIVLFTILICCMAFSPVPTYQIALLKYGGGGDWYANRTVLSGHPIGGGCLHSTRPVSALVLFADSAIGPPNRGGELPHGARLLA